MEGLVNSRLFPSVDINHIETVKKIESAFVIDEAKYTLVPEGNRLIVEMQTSEWEGKFGILIPKQYVDSMKAKTLNAKIIAVGDTVSERFKPGMLIRVGQYAGYSIEFNQEPVVLITDEEILCTLKEVKHAENA